MSNVYPIPATKVVKKQQQARNVAAYCRVSTKLESQENSLLLQVDYYTSYIKSNPDWNFVGVYADSASGRNTKRSNFQKMMQDYLFQFFSTQNVCAHSFEQFFFVYFFHDTSFWFTEQYIFLLFSRLGSVVY